LAPNAKYFYIHHCYLKNVKLFSPIKYSYKVTSKSIVETASYNRKKVFNRIDYKYVYIVKLPKPQSAVDVTLASVVKCGQSNWPRSWLKAAAVAIAHRGCQIFLRATYKNGKYVPKLPQNIPNVHKICIPNGHKIYQMAIKYAKWQKYRRNVNKIYQNFLLQDTPKFTQICVFHLATLLNR
jgi:hypothetical protein